MAVFAFYETNPTAILAVVRSSAAEEIRKWTERIEPGLSRTEEGFGCLKGRVFLE